MRLLRNAPGLIATAGISLLLAACGGNSDKAGHHDRASATASTAIKFSECMRHHGLTNFPDVAPGQGIPIQHELNGSVDILINGVPQPVSSPKLNSAMGACGHYMTELTSASLPAGTTAGTIQRALVRTAACFRRDGVPNYPDPPALGTQQKGHFSPTARARDAGINIYSPAFKAASAKCGPIMSNAMGR